MNLISIIIPAKNEEVNITKTIEGITNTFGQHNIDFEIIVVNDGSTDSTADTVRKITFADSRVRLINNDPPYGIGNAIKRGLECFEGSYVIIAMADASDDPNDMVRYVKEVEQGYDCCFGNRWTKEARVTNYPIHKLILNRMVNWWISFIFGIRYKDITNAFKCYSRKAIKGIQPILSHHFNVTVELPLKALVRGYSYSVVPTNWYNRKAGKSNLKIQEMGSRYLFIILYVLLEKWLCKKDYHKK